jgi:hypothetical protein
MANLTLPVHGKMVTFEDVPLTEVDNLIAAVPRKERDLPFEEVVAYLVKKYSKTGKRKKEPVIPTPAPPAKPSKERGDLKVIRLKKKG